MTTTDVDRVAILDAGSQYGKVIDRRVRELNIASELLPLETSLDKIKQENFKAILISGGPDSVYAEGAPNVDERLWTAGIPILGICYGYQLMTKFFGGEVEKKKMREDGQFAIEVDTSSLLFDGMAATQNVLLTHGDSLAKIPEGWKKIAYIGDLTEGIENASMKIYGVQFHPEVDLTEHGKDVLKNFLVKIAGVKETYSVSDRKQIAIDEILKVVGDKKVLVMVSGGVDSSVCATLIKEAIDPDRIIAIHINNGFMRKNESEKVLKALTDIGMKLKVIDASQDFYNGTTTIAGVETKKLNEVVDPEEKRKIIGDVFVQVAEREIQQLGLKPEEVFLAQGTLRPDLIESASIVASKKAAVIKTHHNDSFLVRKLRELNRVIEPLKDYHKDEVRILGAQLGLPYELVQRQPFPGPGLAIRILCADKPFIESHFEETNNVLKFLLNPEYPKNNTTLSEEKISEIVATVSSLSASEREALETIHTQQTTKEISIAAILLPVKTVGVQGDGRTYNYVCLITCTKPNWQHLVQLAKIFTKICHNINRVVYGFGPIISEPITEITPTRLTPDVIKLLQEADDIANAVFIQSNQLQRLSQVPIILVPVSLTRSGKRCIAIRTMITNDFMTGRPAVPGVDVDEAALREVVERVLTIPDVDGVVYDLTSKPPGTTEWE